MVLLHSRDYVRTVMAAFPFDQDQNNQDPARRGRGQRPSGGAERPSPSPSRN